MLYEVITKLRIRFVDALGLRYANHVLCACRGDGEGHRDAVIAECIYRAAVYSAAANNERVVIFNRLYAKVI